MTLRWREPFDGYYDSHRTLADDLRDAPVDKTPHVHFHAHGLGLHSHEHVHPEEHAHSSRTDLGRHGE